MTEKKVINSQGKVTGYEDFRECKICKKSLDLDAVVNRLQKPRTCDKKTEYSSEPDNIKK